MTSYTHARERRNPRMCSMRGLKYLRRHRRLYRTLTTCCRAAIAIRHFAASKLRFPRPPGVACVIRARSSSVRRTRLETIAARTIETKPTRDGRDPRRLRELVRGRCLRDYERWIDFFAEAIRHSAEVAIETGRRATQSFHQDRALLRAVPRIAGSLLMIQEALQAKPVATVATLREAIGLTTPTINSLLRGLESRGIIKESTGRARDRVYVYRRYIEALAAEEEARVSAAEKPLTRPGKL